MADKDIAFGWGELNKSHTQWYCPKCKVASDVASWAVVWVDVPCRMDGRKCPLCDFQAFQNHETLSMFVPDDYVVPQPSAPPSDPPPDPNIGQEPQ
jgi:hypothetical protein